jgi:hypothetical protein
VVVVAGEPVVRRGDAEAHLGERAVQHQQARVENSGACDDGSGPRLAALRCRFLVAMSVLASVG